MLQVTVVTIRRDLDALERRGLLHRTHGGAMPIQPLFYRPIRIGYAAAALIESDETIAVTSGTTASAVVRALPLNYNL